MGTNDNGFVDINDLGLGDFDEILAISQGAEPEPTKPGKQTSQKSTQKDTSNTELNLEDYFKSDSEWAEELGKVEEASTKEDDFEDLFNFVEDTDTESDDTDLDNELEPIKDDKESDKTEKIVELNLDEKVVKELSDPESILSKVVNKLKETDYVGLTDFLIKEGYVRAEIEGTDFVSSVDYFTDDQLLNHDIRNRCTGCSEEHINDMYLKIRQSQASDAYIKDLRKSYVNMDKLKYQQEQKLQNEERIKAIEKENNEAISKVKALNAIGDFVNKEDIVNKFIPFLKKDDTGTSKFIQEISSDPVKQYKAMVYLQLEDKMRDHYKQELERSFKLGVESVIGSGKKVENKVTSSPKTSKKRSVSEPKLAGDTIDFDSITEDELMDISELTKINGL